MQETRVVLGIDEPGLHEELLHFLERLPGVRVVGVAENKELFRRMVEDREPDSVIGIPELISGADLPPAIAVAPRETTKALRAAIRAGARGFYVWPAEREALGREVMDLQPQVRSDASEKGLVIAVLGARGGAGATFFATNLAGALCRRHDTVLVDLDPMFGDVTPALGVAADATVASVTDLVAVARELTWEHVDRVLQPHPAGFRVLFAPQDVSHEPRLDGATAQAVVRVLRQRFDATVLHLPRRLDEVVRFAAELADDVLVVVTLDMLGVRSARRLLDALRSAGLGESLRLLVNKTRRGEILPEDAELVLGVPIAGVIRSDPGVERAQNRGELVVGRRGGVARSLDRLAKELVQGRAA